MKKDKIFEFELKSDLTDRHRKALEEAIEQAAEDHDTDLEYGWQEDDDSRLHVFIKPVEIEVRFLDRVAELHAAAPVWARAGFTRKRKQELRALVDGILRDASLIDTPAAA